MSTRNDADGIPYAVVEHAETKGRRLYLDGEPFPYATSGEHDLTVIREHGLTVLLVPVVVDGPVTVTPKLHGTGLAERADWVGEQRVPLRVRDAPADDLA